MKFDDLKRSCSKARMLAIARDEGLKTMGERFQCPARCSDDPRSTTASDLPTGGAVFHCQRCGTSGSALDLLVHARRIELGGAAEVLAGLLHHLPDPGPAKPKPQVDAAALWRGLATADEAGQTYLAQRGLGAAAHLVRFNVGGTGNAFLDARAREGYRVAMALYSTEGGVASLQVRSVVLGLPSKDAKRSLWGAPYPPTGVAFGDIGRARTAPRVYVTEGMADTLAVQLAGVPVLGAPGVDQVAKLYNFLGNLKGREVVLCPQNDPDKVKLPSAEAFERLGRKLLQAGAQVLRLVTPAPHKDPADWLKSVGVDVFRAAAETELEPVREPGSDDDVDATVFDGQAALKVVPMPERAALPEIRITVEQHLVNDQAVLALGADTRIYQRAGFLVHVVMDAGAKGLDLRGTSAPRISPLPAPVLRERMTAVAAWKKFQKQEHAWMPAHPPDWSVQAVHARGTWDGIRYLAGVVETPVLRPDGSVLDEPGYDEATQLLYIPSGDFAPVPQRPTEEQAIAARDLLLEVFADFPFSKPAHQAACLAGLLTPFARHAFEGPTPLTLFDANTRGAGKSLSTDVVALIVTGRPMARMTQAKDDEEMRKRITSVAMAGDPLVLIDNVEGTLGSESLNAALTGTTWRDRLLGSNHAPTLPLTATWYATGNNVVLDGDTTRRTLHVRLETPFEKPEERKGFRHPDLKGWVKQKRPELVHAALTLLRAYSAAGQPQANIPSWGSYEGWSRVVRHCLVWAGLPDPGLTREELAEVADSERALLEGIIAAWELVDPTRSGMTVKEVIDRIEGDAAKYARVREVLEELAPPKAGAALSAKSIGRRLAHLRGRVIGGLCLDLNGADRDGKSRWKLRAVRQAEHTAGLQAEEAAAAAPF